MSVEMFADKIEKIAPEHMGELMQFIDFLLFRQNAASAGSNISTPVRKEGKSIDELFRDLFRFQIVKGEN